MRASSVRPAILAATLAFTTATGLVAQSLAITGATVIDGTGRAPIANAVVLIENGRITAVGPAATTAVSGSATRIDAKGKYVIPGLMDANLHLYLNGDLESLIRYEGRYHEIVLEGAQIALRTGQTTVFDTWGPRADLVKVRDMINAGQAVGSRIYLAGNIIGFSGPLGPDFFGAAAAHASKAFVKRTNAHWEEGTGRDLLWMPPDSLRAAIRRYTALGVDFLKYGASGHVDMNLISFSERAQRVIVEEGHRAGKTVQTHTTSPESLDMAIEAGVDIITHGDISGPLYPIPEETLKKLVERNISVSVLAITKRSLDALVAKSPEGILTPYMKVAATNIRNMVKAGVRLMISTDAGVQDPIRLSESPTLASDTVDARVKLGEGHFNALVSLEEAGLAPMEILKSATSNIARAYKVDRELGTLEAGKAADLVILDADPLASARNYRRINSVIKDGKVVDLAKLPTAPVISALKAASQQPSPCPAAGFGPGVECRVLMVAENPEQPDGRKIPIRYALARATGTAPRPEALFLFSGGPGAGSTEMAGLATGLLAPVLALRDIVMVDQRGSGGSNPLMCPAELRKHPDRAFGTMFPPAAMADCRTRLGAIADLTRYTTDYAIGDIEQVRQSLGYPRIILWGGSYGTRIEQAYARRFPDRVKAMVLDGVVPFDFSLPLSYAATLQESIDRLLAGCRTRAGCRDSFPDLERQWTSLVAKFKHEPVAVTVTPRAGAPVKVQMSLGDFGYAVRGVLYRADVSRQLPARIAEAALSGNLDWFAARYYARAADFEEDFADGLHLAAVCNEETVWIRDADVGPATAGSFIGTYLIDQYRETCRGWPRAQVDSSFRRPLTAPIPTLLVSGLFDPVTPPRIAERVARYLPVSRHIVDSTGHHGSSFRCAQPAVMHMLKEGTLEGAPEVCGRP